MILYLTACYLRGDVKTRDWSACVIRPQPGKSFVFNAVILRFGETTADTDEMPNPGSPEVTCGALCPSFSLCQQRGLYLGQLELHFRCQNCRCQRSRQSSAWNPIDDLSILRNFLAVHCFGAILLNRLHPLYLRA